MTAPSIPPAGGHGGDGDAVARALGIARDEVVDLSASLNPVAPDIGPLVLAHLDAIHHYPDPGSATRAAATVLGVDSDRLLLTNGGSEAIALVAAHLQEGQVDEPEFSLYRRHLDRIDPAAGRWRSNPNNPTGRLAAPDDTAAVWDEAFYPLTTGRWTRGDAERGAIVVGSLTKLLACPGLRLGFVIADPGTIRALAERQPCWAVSGLACGVLPQALEQVELAAWAGATRELRDDLERLVRQWGGRPEPSDAPWLLVDVGNAAAARADLARHRLVVRDCTSFGLPSHIRIAVPRAGDLPTLRAAFARTEPAHTATKGAT